MPKILPVKYEDEFCYNIIFDQSFANLVENIILIKREKYDKICIVTDDIVEKLYLNEIETVLRDKFNCVITQSLPNGEKSKQLSNIEKLYEELIRNHFTRSDLLIALGGGVIGDMTGFCAATYLRGIDFIQIPTTLLSQVDSSIGGKTGVDYLSYKNMVGAFYMPKLVYINLNVLKSLSKEQFACGMGEVIKYGCISDADFFQWLGENEDQIQALRYEALEHMVYTCCDIKRQVVEIDPKEHGIRSYLNFGHTIGHAIEKLSDFRLYHGQCVAIGMIAAAYLSVMLGRISETDLKALIDVLQSYDLPIKTSGMSAEDVYQATRSDKKMSGDKVKFIVLNEIGKADSYTDFTKEDLLKGISYVLKGANEDAE